MKLVFAEIIADANANARAVAAPPEPISSMTGTAATTSVGGNRSRTNPEPIAATPGIDTELPPEPISSTTGTDSKGAREPKRKRPGTGPEHHARVKTIDIEKDIERLRLSFGDNVTLVDALLEIRRLENKSGKVAITALFGLLDNLQKTRAKIDDDLAFSAGLSAAVAASAPNANYVAKAARSAQARQRTSVAPLQRAPAGASDANSLLKRVSAAQGGSV